MSLFSSIVWLNCKNHTAARYCQLAARFQAHRDRKGKWLAEHLATLNGALQVDGYADDVVY